MLTKKFDISQSTAYNDIDRAYFIHGKTGKLRRDVELYFLSQFAKRNVRDAFASRNISKQTKALEVMAKVLALFKEEEAIDWEKIQPNNYYLVINQSFGAQLKTLKIDLNKVNELPEEEKSMLLDQLNDSFDQETIKMLTADE
jgi:hypothetical protein